MRFKEARDLPIGNGLRRPAFVRVLRPRPIGHEVEFRQNVLREEAVPFPVEDVLQILQQQDVRAVIPHS